MDDSEDEGGVEADRCQIVTLTQKTQNEYVKPPQGHPTLCSSLPKPMGVNF